MLLNLQNSFEDRECMHYFVLNFNIFLPIGSCANLKNVSTSRKRAIALSCLQKSFVNAKAFGVKRLRTY
jgi:hypothetical protein